MYYAMLTTTRESPLGMFDANLRHETFINLLQTNEFDWILSWDQCCCCWVWSMVGMSFIFCGVSPSPPTKASFRAATSNGSINLLSTSNDSAWEYNYSMQWHLSLKSTRNRSINNSLTTSFQIKPPPTECGCVPSFVRILMCSIQTTNAFAMLEWDEKQSRKNHRHHRLHQHHQRSCPIECTTSYCSR